MEVNLRNLSRDTLVGIVGDLNAMNYELDNKNERLSTDLVKEREEYRRSEGTDSDHRQKYYKKQVARVLRIIIDGAVDLSDIQAIIVFGLVAEAGEKIMAIRAYRNRFGTGLKESKEAVEQWRENNHLPVLEGIYPCST